MALFSSTPMFSLTTETSDTNTGVTFVNGKYYVGTGGGGTSPEYEEDQSGSILQTAEPNPGLDFRSLFTDASQQVFARGFSDNAIYVQTSFGNFAPYLALDGDIDAQQKVVFDPQQQDYVGINGSQVQQWNLDGTIRSLTDLPDYAPDGTNSIAVFNGKWYTYDGNNNIDVIDPATGVTLDSQASPVQSGYSLAIANRHLFLSDNSGPYYAYELADGNTAPAAGNDSVQTLVNTSVTMSASELLANDGDAENDLLGIASVRSETNGAATLNQDGSVTFSPDPGFFGLASFSYRATDTLDDSNQALVSVAVVTPPVYTVTAAGNVSEGTGGGGHTVDFTVTRAGDISLPGEVDLTFGGSAALGTDYTVSGASLNTNQLAFAANSSTATLTATTVADGAPEGDESIVLGIDNPQGEAGATIGTPAGATALILNDDQAPSGPQPGPIASRTGSDTIVAAPRGETIVGDDRDDRVNGHDGNDLIRLGNGRDTAYGGAGDDSIVAGNGDDLLFGGTGSDTIRTGDGDNTVLGGSGDATDSTDAADLIITGAGADWVFGNGGQDVVAAGGGADLVAGGLGDDVVLGNQGNDVLQGNEGNDTLVGGFGADTVVGGRGDDFIMGNEGADLLYGDEGQNTFAFNAGDTNVLSGGGIDTIADFARGRDRIAFQTAPGASPSNFAATTVVGASLERMQKTAQKLVNGGDAFVFVSDGTNGILFADLDGDRTIDNAVKLVGLADANALTWSDLATPAGR